MQIFHPNIENVPILPNFSFVPLLPVPFLLGTTHNTSIRKKSNHPSLLNCEPTQ